MKGPRKTENQSPSENAHLSAGREVLKIEADALIKLEHSLGNTFSTAIEKLCQINGRVVVTGMGKSGHIGKKVAATLSSTGTPALFVHPAEASH